MRKSDTIAELAKALSGFQGAMKSVPKAKKNPHFQSNYADLDAIWEVVRNPLKDNGLSIVQTTDSDPEGDLFLETTLFHSSGEFISSVYPINPMRQVKDEGWQASGDPQSLGSAITYARRYSMSAMLGISAEDDDDAEGAMNREGKAPAQRTRQANADSPALDPNSENFCKEHKVMWFKRGQMKNYAHTIGEGIWCNKPKDKEPAQDPPESEQEQAFEDLAGDTTETGSTTPDTASAPDGITILKHTDFWKAAHERYGEGQAVTDKILELFDKDIAKWIKAGTGRTWQVAWDHVCGKMKVG